MEILGVVKNNLFSVNNVSLDVVNQVAYCQG